MTYVERYVKFGEEDSWGTSVATDSYFNYLLRWDGEVTEHRIEEPVIAGYRDAKSRVFTQREVVATAQAQLTSARFLEYALGSISLTGGSSLPATIEPSNSTLPSLTFQRVFRPVEGSEDNALTLWGLKVDSFEITLEQGEDVVVEYSFAGKDGTIETVTYSAPDIDYTVVPFAYQDGVLTWGGTTLGHVIRAVITGNNNLEARFAASGTIGTVFTCQELREGQLDVSGRFTIDRPLSTYAKAVLDRGEGTIVLTLTRAGTGTITITLSNVALESYSESVSGLDAIEVEYPFTCRRKDTTIPAIRIVQSGTGAWSSLVY